MIFSQSHSLFIFFLVIQGILLAPGEAMSQQLRSAVDRDSVAVGDLFVYTLVMEKGDSVSAISYPEREDFDNETISYLSRELFRVAANRDSVVYHLQFFGIDDYEIPEKEIEITAENGTSALLSTAPVTLFFQSVMEEGDEEFRPLKPIFEFGTSLWPLLIVLVILAFAGWLLYRWWSRREVAEPPAPLPILQPFVHPLKILRSELDELSGSSSPLVRRDYKEFYIRLGDAIRHYFEEVYEINALEMTSREILVALRDYPADLQIIESTRKVLNEADVVKFARYAPDSEQARNALNIAYRFAEIVEDIDQKRVERKRKFYENEQLRGRESFTTEETAI